MATEKPDGDGLTFSGEERVKQLAEIDKNIAKLLRSAGEAVQALSNQSGKDGSTANDEEARATFSAATSQYFSLLSSVDVNLRRQIWALEEANIIAPAPTDKEGQSSKEKNPTETGGIGNLDVAWLNSRNDKIGKEMEAELWEKASSLIESTGVDVEKRGAPVTSEAK